MLYKKNVSKIHQFFNVFFLYHPCEERVHVGGCVGSWKVIARVMEILVPGYKIRCFLMFLIGMRWSVGGWLGLSSLRSC